MGAAAPELITVRYIQSTSSSQQAAFGGDLYEITRRVISSAAKHLEIKFKK